MENPKLHYFNKDFSEMQTMEILMVCMNDWVVACTGTNWYGGNFSKVQPFLRDELCCVFECPTPDHKHKIEVRNAKGEIIKPHEFRCQKLMLCPGFFGRGWDLWVDGAVFCQLSLEYWRSFRQPGSETH